MNSLDTRVTLRSLPIGRCRNQELYKRPRPYRSLIHGRSLIGSDELRRSAAYRSYTIQLINHREKSWKADPAISSRLWLAGHTTTSSDQERISVCFDATRELEIADG